MRKTMTVPRRALPGLRAFFVQNTALMYRFILAKVGEVIRTGSTDDVQLFHMGDSSTSAVIKYKDFTKVLTDAMTYFSGIEEYEQAAAAQSLLTQHMVEQVINETK